MVQKIHENRISANFLDVGKMHPMLFLIALKVPAKNYEANYQSGFVMYDFLGHKCMH